MYERAVRTDVSIQCEYLFLRSGELKIKMCENKQKFVFGSIPLFLEISWASDLIHNEVVYCWIHCQ